MIWLDLIWLKPDKQRALEVFMRKLIFEEKTGLLIFFNVENYLFFCSNRCRNYSTKIIEVGRLIIISGNWSGIISHRQHNSSPLKRKIHFYSRVEFFLCWYYPPNTLWKPAKSIHIMNTSYWLLWLHFKYYSPSNSTWKLEIGRSSKFITYVDLQKTSSGSFFSFIRAFNRLSSYAKHIVLHMALRNKNEPQRA